MHLARLLLGAGLLLATSLARADAPPRPLGAPCAADADCGGGLGCVESTATWCEELPGETPTCEERTARTCTPRDCAPDGSCEAGLSCEAFARVACPGGPVIRCDASGRCVADEAGEGCEPATLRQCVPRWWAPCDADAGCGPGFACVPDEACTWPEGGGGPVCTPTGANRCALEQTSCAGTGDCGAGLGCFDLGAFFCALEASLAPDAADDACADVSLPLCVPPDFEYWLEGPGGGSADGGSLVGEGTQVDRGPPLDEDGGCQSAGGGLPLLALLGVGLLLRRR